jgi:hypothetical protein
MRGPAYMYIYVYLCNEREEESSLSAGMEKSFDEIY